MTQVEKQSMQRIDSEQCRENRTIVSTDGTVVNFKQHATYIQYDKHPKNYHNSGISAVNKYKNHSDVKEERDMIELDFGPTQNILKEEYLDVYEGIKSEIVNTTRFDENSNLSSTYLGKSDRPKYGKLKAEVSFPISEQGYTLGKLLCGPECELLLDRSKYVFHVKILLHAL